MYNEEINKIEIKHKTGIDLEMYRTDDIVNSMEDLLSAPFKIIVQLIIWPLLFAILLNIVGIWLIWPLSWTGAILWMLNGLIMGPLCGLALASYLIAVELGGTTKKLYAATLDCIKTIAKDLKDNFHQIPEGQKLPSHKEWMRIVQTALIVPVVRELARKKFWPVGTWIANLLVVNLTKSSQKGEFVLQQEFNNLEEQGKKNLESYREQIIRSTDIIYTKLNNTHRAAMSITIKPLRFTMFMTFGLTMFFMMLIYYFFLY